VEAVEVVGVVANTIHNRAVRLMARIRTSEEAIQTVARGLEQVPGPIDRNLQGI
jgi:hypothetical protein